MVSIIISTITIVIFVLLTLKVLEEFGLETKIITNHFSLRERITPNVSKDKHIMKIFLMSLLSRIMILVIGIIIIKTFSEGNKNIYDCFLELQKWDAVHYINLVEKGYSGYIDFGKHLFVVFFPAYVWIVRVVKIIVIDTVLAGTLVSVICYALGCCYTYKIANHYFNEKVAKQAVIYLSLFPFSFFSGVVMTEGLFLFATTGACYYAIKKKWFLFSVFGVLASTTKMVGVLVIIFASIEIIKTFRPLQNPIFESIRISLKPMLRYIPLLITPFIGILIYWGLNYYVEGNMFAYVTHQKEHWYNGFMWFPEVINYLTDYFIRGINQSQAWETQFTALASLILFLIVLFKGLFNKKIPSSLIVYAFCYVIANYSLAWLISAGRYLSCCFTIFIILAKITEDKEDSRIIIMSLEAIFLGIYFVSYLTGGHVL